MARRIIEICSSATRQEAYKLEGIEGLTIEQGEQVAIVGGNGSGKSILVGIMTGAHPLIDGAGVKYDFGADATSERVFDNIKYMAFRDNTASSGGIKGEDGVYFHQQRWNSTTLDEMSSVGEELAMVQVNAGEKLRERLFELFAIEAMMDKKLPLLSSGEMRKFQITKALLGAPQLLIMDNPFIGLDAATRDLLHKLLGELTAMGDVQVIIVLSKTDDIPEFITHIIEVENRHCKAKIEQSQYRAPEIAEVVLPADIRAQIIEMPQNEAAPNCDVVAELRGVSVKYGERTILRALDWSVKQGERWALSGENGAGKSTLLSLVCADNPQAYACDIALFGRDRGTGESIWDIKRNIGYVSPEMHRAYLQPLRALEIVASGLHDTIGLSRKMQPEQEDICRFWLRVFGVEESAERNFMQLSSGEQRLVLLARAFVKDPALYILDEPLHGLDMVYRKRVTEVIDAVCSRPGKSLIMVSHYPADLPSCITHSLHLTKN